VPVSRAKRRLLFVDDEPAILDALQAVLRRQRHEWDMVFAVGGAAGLAQIDNSSFDVVVTDMRMPGINGAELLRQVKSKQPHAVRLVLSGQTDTETAMKTVFTAHQFLAKPCDAEQLLAVVKRACELNELVSREELRSLAGDITLLPSAPRTFLAISVALSTPSCSIDDIAQIIERDPALCAKVLQVANSAFFGLPRTVTSVASAATYLGTLTLRNLALAMETLAVTGKQRPLIPSVRLEAFQLNSLFVGLLARQWFENDRHKGDDAFVAGMLRDLGHFVLLNQPLEPRASPESHAMLSAYLLGLWGIPHSVLEPVAFHEHPEQLEHETLEIVDVVHLADRICGELLPSPFQAEPGALDTERLARLGVTSERIEQLRGQAVKLLPQVKALLGS
jgi:HD-like signal output (HDOD) protein